MSDGKPRFELLLGGKGRPVAETQTRAQAAGPRASPSSSAPPAPAPRTAPRPNPVRTLEERKAMTRAPLAAAWWTKPGHRSADGSSRTVQVLRLMVDGQWHDAPTLMQAIPGARAYLVKGTARGFLELDRASGIVKPKLGAPGRPRDRWRLTPLGRAFVEMLG